eukprot:tig00020611_g12106.t1
MRAQKTQVQIVSPSTDFKQNSSASVLGQNCTITWQAAPVLGTATTFDQPESWATGEQRSVSFSIGYPILTSNISARFYDLHGFFQRLRAANGSSILSIIDKLTVDATISEGKRDPGHRQRYALGTMLRVEVTTPVTPAGNNVRRRRPSRPAPEATAHARAGGVRRARGGVQRWTDPTTANLSSPAAECTAAPSQYNVTLNFTAGPGSSVMLTSASAPPSTTRGDMLESFEGALVKCVADDRAGERERSGQHLPARPARRQFQDRFQYAMKLTFTNAEGSCAAPPPPAGLQRHERRAPAAGHPAGPELVGRMVRRSRRSTFTATATLVRAARPAADDPTPPDAPATDSILLIGFVLLLIDFFFGATDPIPDIRPSSKF